MVTVTEHERVRRHTAPEFNRDIDQTIAETVHRYAGLPHFAISLRLQQLEQTWDIERTLEANASTLALGGLLLGATVHRRWLLLPGVVLGFLSLHAFQGWCPPLPVLRRLGVRTRSEIERERFALKYLRGDFADIDLAQVRAEPEKLLAALAR